MLTLYIMGAVLVCVVCAALTTSIAHERQRSGAWFLAGLFFGPLGLMVVAASLLPGHLLEDPNKKQTSDEDTNEDETVVEDIEKENEEDLLKKKFDKDMAALRRQYKFGKIEKQKFIEKRSLLEEEYRQAKTK